jgi:anaerobic selenocysteine-containing dehydrogenase
MLMQNTNPMLTAPDSAAVRSGLARDDLFLCVHEQFMTDTARMADLVLPATSFVEHDDIYVTSGHTFLQVARALIPPVGDSRPNHAVINAVAQRLGARHPAFALTEWQVIDAVLQASGKPGADQILAAGGLDCAPDFARAHFLDGFGHDDGRFRFAPDWASLGPRHQAMPPLPDHMAASDAPTEAKPYRLVAAPSRHFLNSTFTETPGSLRRENRPTLRIHRALCARLGLAEGAVAQIGNERGTITLHVQPVDDMDEATLVVESIWPAQAFIGGQGINLLVSGDAAAPNGGAVFHDTAVWLRPVPL